LGTRLKVEEKDASPCQSARGKKARGGIKALYSQKIRGHLNRTKDPGRKSRCHCWGDRPELNGTGGSERQKRWWRGGWGGKKQVKGKHPIKVNPYSCYPGETGIIKKTLLNREFKVSGEKGNRKTGGKNRGLNSGWCGRHPHPTQARPSPLEGGEKKK